MKVAVDARRMQDAPLGGVGRTYVNVLPFVAPEVPLVLIGDARRPAPVIPGLAGTPYTGLRAPRGAPEAVWLQFAAARWLHVWDGLFHATFIAAPLWPNVPLVLTIMDLSYEHHPEDFSAVKRRLFQATCRVSARRARRVVTATEVVRQEVIERYRVPADRILVSPCCVDPVFRARDRDPGILTRLGVAGPYVVAMGGAPRRGLEVAIAAWRQARLWADGIGLVVVGPTQPSSEPGITWVGRIADNEWATVLAGAVAFCWPTRFEGFGMPGLEAIASGTPVVCARLPVLEESLGPAAEWCEEPTVESIAAGLSRVVASPGRAQELRDAGLAQAAAAPTWEQAAAVYVRAYREAAS